MGKSSRIVERRFHDSLWAYFENIVKENVVGGGECPIWKDFLSPPPKKEDEKNLEDKENCYVTD